MVDSLWSLDDFIFPLEDSPSGSRMIGRTARKKWSEFEPIGAYDPGTILTYISTPSAKFTLPGVCTAATAAELENRNQSVTRQLLKSPWYPSGFYIVVMNLNLSIIPGSIPPNELYQYEIECMRRGST